MVVSLPGNRSSGISFGHGYAYRLEIMNALRFSGSDVNNQKLGLLANWLVSPA
jgi:hypothetical protein